VPSLQPKARPAGWFSCRAGPRPIKPTTAHFINIFHQILKYFIILTNITINNTYIQVITTPTVHFYRAATGPFVGTGHARAVLRAWVVGQAWPSALGRAKSLSHGPGHQAMGCMAMYAHHPLGDPISTALAAHQPATATGLATAICPSLFNKPTGHGRLTLTTAIAAAAATAAASSSSILACGDLTLNYPTNPPSQLLCYSQYAITDQDPNFQESNGSSGPRRGYDREQDRHVGATARRHASEHTPTPPATGSRHVQVRLQVLARRHQRSPLATGGSPPLVVGWVLHELRQLLHLGVLNTPLGHPLHIWQAGLPA